MFFIILCYYFTNFIKLSFGKLTTYKKLLTYFCTKKKLQSETRDKQQLETEARKYSHRRRLNQCQRHCCKNK